MNDEICWHAGKSAIYKIKKKVLENKFLKLIRLRANNEGFESQQGMEMKSFSTKVATITADHPSSCTVYTILFRGWSSRRVTLTTQLHLERTLRMSKAILILILPLFVFLETALPSPLTFYPFRINSLTEQKWSRN